MSAHQPDDLQRIYHARFGQAVEYRKAVWRVLVDEFFQTYVRPDARVMDLGCGYGEFINQVRAGKKFAMDLNPDAPRWLGADTEFILHDCSQRWPLTDGAVNVVFTSNLFEHLPHKAALGQTLDEIRRCLAKDGLLVAMGPNIKFVPGSYWDFWDHYVPLTELSLSEALETRGFAIDRCEDRFLPYTMARGPQYPVAFLSLYLKLRLAWKFLGKQFLVIARKPAESP